MSSPDIVSVHRSVRSGDPVAEKRLLRKLNLCLTSFAFFSYFTSNLVRKNMRKLHYTSMNAI